MEWKLASTFCRFCLTILRLLKIKYRHVLHRNMALREVKPLDEEQWNQVVSALKIGPTEAQRQMIEEASAHVSRLNIKRS